MPNETDFFEFAPGWRPEVGDEVIGTVVDVTTGENEYGKYPIITLKRDDGSLVAVHGFHTVLRNQFKRARPRVGEQVGVRYIQSDTDNEKGYHNYSVRVKRNEGGTLDWDAIPD